MGLETAAVVGIVSGVLSAASAGVSAAVGNHQQKKAVSAQNAAAREAAARNVNVGRAAPDPEQSVTDVARAGEEQSQAAARRRQGLASTVRGGSLLSSLGTGRTKLGGL